MKTFQEFILEASAAEEEDVDVAKKAARLRVKARELRQRGDTEGAFALEIEAGQLQAGTRRKINALDKKPTISSNPNSITGGGYAQTGRRGRIGPDPTSSVGTQSGVDRTGVHDLRQGGRRIGSATAPGEVVAGKYDKVTGGRGTRVNRSGGTVGRKG